MVLFSYSKWRVNLSKITLINTPNLYFLKSGLLFQVEYDHLHLTEQLLH
jgi:hypothetical protein